MTSIRSKWILAAALTLYLALALAGIRFGLPDSGHNLSYNCDETTWLSALGQIHPAERKFNPHPYLTHPTLYLEMYMAAVYVGAKVGWIPLSQDKEWFRQHPEVFARFYLAGRYLQVACGLALLFLIWFGTRRLFNDWIAGAATLLLSVTPSLISASHFSQASLPVALLTTGALIGLMFFARTGFANLRLLYVTAFVLGCAISAKFSALALVPVLAYCIIKNERWVRRGTIAGLLVAFGFFVGSPFALISPRSFWPAFFWHVQHQQDPIGHFWQSLSFPFQFPLSAALGPILLGAVVLAFLYYARTYASQTEFVLLAWIVIFFIGIVRVGRIAASARVLVVLPSLMMMLAIALDRLKERHRSLSSSINLAVAALGMSALVCSLAILNVRRTPPLQKTVSSWIEANIPRDATIAIPRNIFWWTPDIIYQSSHHPERMEHPYKIFDLQFSKKAGEEANADYLVASTTERFHCKENLNATPQQCAEFDAWLDDGRTYEVMKVFPRRVGVGPWEWNRPEIPSGFDDDIWATAMTIYKRRAEPTPPPQRLGE